MRFSTIIAFAVVAVAAPALSHRTPHGAAHGSSAAVAHPHGGAHHTRELPVYFTNLQQELNTKFARREALDSLFQREIVDEFVRREAVQSGSGANWLTSLGGDIFSLFSGGSNNNRREDVLDSVFRREVVDEFYRRETVQQGSGANWLTSLGEGIFSLFGGSSSSNSNRREDASSYMLTREIANEFARREAVAQGSGANWLTSLGEGIFSLFDGSSSSNNNRREDLTSSMLKREIADEFYRRETVQQGSGANWLTSLGEGIFSLFDGSSSSNSNRREDATSYMLTREIANEFARREAVAQGSGANWLTSLGEGIFSLFDSSSSSNNSRREDATSYMLTRQIANEFARREAVEQGSGANWLTSLGKGIFSLFSGGSSNNNNNNSRRELLEALAAGL